MKKTTHHRSSSSKPFVTVIAVAGPDGEEVEADKEQKLEEEDAQGNKKRIERTNLLLMPYQIGP